MITFHESDSGFPWVRHHVTSGRRRPPELFNHRKASIKKGIFNVFKKALEKNLLTRIVYKDREELEILRFEFYAMGRVTGCVKECYTFDEAHEFIRNYGV